MNEGRRPHLGAHRDFRDLFPVFGRDDVEVAVASTENQTRAPGDGAAVEIIFGGEAPQGFTRNFVDPVEFPVVAPYSDDALP